MITKTLKISLFVLAVASFSFVGAQEKQEKNKVDYEKIFKGLDADESGSISLEEFKAKRMKAPSKEAQVEKRFTQMDTDESGLVDLAEFKKFLEQPRSQNQKINQKSEEKKG